VRIAVVTQAFPVLSEAPFLNQITGLVERGHQVDIYADQSQPDVPAHPDVARLGLVDRTRYPAVLPRSGRARWAAAIQLIKANRGSNRTALLRTLNPFVFWRRAVSLDQLRRTAPFLPPRPYDVCYCPFAQDARQSLRFRRLGVLEGKLVVALRGADVSRYVARRGKRVYRQLFREGELFLPVCRALADRATSLGCPPSRMVVHHTGINLGRFPFRPRGYQAGEQLRLVSIGRLVEKKGIEYALQGVRELVSDGLDLSYDIVGDGPLRRPLESRIQQMGLGGRVRLLGWLGHRQVSEWLDRSHVLLAPSVTADNGDQEGIPNIIREGMAVGLPVIATVHSGIPELIEDGVSGYLVPERDAAALAAGIRHLAGHPAEWRPLTAAARAKVEEDDIEKLNDRFVALLEGVTRS
jgi:colanic acid/amylovoran/stewartan biosynthesis glycosyltransferase WcaL/AmsK/CpsK